MHALTLYRSYMEFYSERCNDWLEKNNNIHPKKLNMEVARFQKMLSDNESQQPIQQDHIDDLKLTLQLLNERLITPDQKIDMPAPEQEQHWDTSSLTHHEQASHESLSLLEKTQRREAILACNGIQLGTANLKKRP